VVHHPDATPCSGADPADGVPPGPFVAPNYHFGMLLGVADLNAERGYHRGKTRLHNAWLHGGGVVWGYPVTVSTESGEVRVGPGLAQDGAGRELPLDTDHCVNVGQWYVKNRPDLPANPTQPFDLRLVARFKPCFSLPVPAIAQPCEGAARETECSRVVETVELRLLLLKGDDPAPPPPPFHRLRLVLGLDQPRTANGAIDPEDQKILDALNAGSRPDLAALLAADVIDRRPAPGEPGEPLNLFPQTDADAEVLLAHIIGVTLEPDGDGWKLAAGEAHPEVRPVLLPTAAIQDLILGRTWGGAGPRVTGAALAADGKSIAFTTDRALLPATVTPDAVSVTYVDGATGAGGWKPAGVQPPTLDAARTTATVPFNAAIPSNARVRLIVRGTGPAPVLGADFAPLAGPGSAPPTPHDGADFVFTARRP
jgi:hypothetical protein